MEYKGEDMGLSITGKYEDAPEYSMAYSSFFMLRKDIMNTISNELGDAYGDTASAMLHNVRLYMIRLKI